MVSRTIRTLLCLLCLAEGVPAFAQSSAQPAQAASRSSSLLHQMETEVSDLVAQAQGSVVAVEGRITLLNLLFPAAVRSQLLNEFGNLSAEKRAEMERNFSQLQESLKSSDKAKMFAAGPSQAGSGFLITGGFVVTTAEVVENMTDVAVVLSNGKRLRPLWINSDPYSNIAILRVNAPSGLGLNWGDSQRAKAGHFAIALGNQAGFANSVSLGLVSGINRSGRSGNLRYHGLIQFQGVVGAGNSGSPLLNSQGEVIGMVVAAPGNGNEAVAMPSARSGAGVAAPPEPPQAPPPVSPKHNAAILFFDGIANTGFALPTQQLRPIIETLCQGANVKPIRDGWVGVRLPPESEQDSTTEAQIILVYTDSPAARAGLLPGDIVIAINGQPIKTLDKMRQAIQNIKAGKMLLLDILRGSTQHHRTLTTEPRPDMETIRQLPVIEKEEGKK